METKYKNIEPKDVGEFEYLLEYEVLTSWWATSIFVAWIPERRLRAFVWWYYVKKTTFKFNLYNSRRIDIFKREKVEL
jgi:hypothetical protein